MINRQYKSSSSLLRSPKLHLNEPKIRISDLPNSKFNFHPKSALYLSKKTDFESRIVCNVEDVFKKSPSSKLKTNLNLDLSLSPANNLTVTRLHRSNEESYTQQDLSLSNSIDSKISSIFEDIHELTLGPNAILHDENKEVTTKQEDVPDSKNSNCNPVCQDIAMSNEDNSALDEEIRIYLKNECTEKSYSDSSKKFLEAMNQFSSKQKQEYLDKKKSIELSVISNQLQQQTQLTTEAQSSANLNMVKKNVMARQGILNVLQELMKQETEDQLKKEKEKQEGLMAISKLVTNSVNTFKSKEEIYLSNLAKCTNVARFQQEGQELIGYNKRVCVDLIKLITKCKQGSVTNEDVTDLNKLMAKSLDCFDRLSKIHETIQAETAAAAAAAVAAEAATAAAASKAKAELLKQAQQTVQAIPVRTQVPDMSSSVDMKPSSTDTISPLSTIIDPISLQIYKTTSEVYKSVEKKLDGMMTDADLKTFRFQCIKAFNIPINAIDTQHTLEQYNRLTSVLRGDKTVGTGRNMRRISDHPLGVLFCKYSMAKKFVSHVDVKPRVLFAYASVIVELWREFPDFGDLLLGAFHQECPYLIPVFWPQQEGQTNEDYYKSLGYHYIDGQVEKQELFLKRMIAMTQLYAAITITPTRPCGSNPHPHNLLFSWRWMAAMLNLDPQPDVSATLLYSYIKIAGNKMAATYRKQFFKLIHFIKKNYLQRIKQVTPEDQSQQSISILEELINNIVKTNHVPPPEGQLPAKLW